MNPEVVGVTAQDEMPDPESVILRMAARHRQYRETQARKRNQLIRFPGDRPVGIAFVADSHIGNDGTDIDRLIHEARLIAQTPNLYCIHVGDLVDNFIVQKLLALRLGTSTTIPEEWAVAAYVLDILAAKLLGMAAGNHDGWTRAVAGIDQLRAVLAKIRPDALYGTDELYVQIQVGNLAIPARIRHKWRYSSLYNPTHGIERSYERDQSKPFLLGVGAHTHVSGLSRQFNAGGRTGLALICGAYKVIDPFAEQLGLPAPNGSTAVVAVFDPKHGITGFDNLNLAINYLEG